MSVLSIVAADNDLGHPICDNLRDGDWMSGYTASRLKHNHGTRAVRVLLVLRLDYTTRLVAHNSFQSP